MVALAEVMDRLDAWAEETRAGRAPVMDKSIVHKHHQENAFISRLERVDDDHPDDIIGQLALDPTHPFFFEHPLDHYPGLMLVEAGRQFGTAVAHLLYGVPADTGFILNGMTVDFTTFAELDAPVFVNSTVRDKKFKRDLLTGMFYQGHFVQNGEEIGFMSGRWSIYPKRVIERMRRAARKAPAKKVPG